MKLTNKVITGLLTAMVLSWAQAVYAAGSTEFGVADDLTVYGNVGTAADPDVEVKGFTVFGSTQSVYSAGAVVGGGNVVVNGVLAVSSGAYVVGGTTLAGSAFFTGISSFTAGPASMYINGGNSGQVMTKNTVTGAMQWADVSALAPGDNLGNHIATMTLNMSNFGIVNASSITANSYITTYGSMTVSGNEGVGGMLNVTGAEVVGGSLTVNNAAYFGSALTKSTFTATGDLQVSSGGVITLLGNASKITLPNLPSIGTDAVNKTYVDTQLGTGGPWTRDNVNNAVKLSTITDSVGVGVAIPTAKLQVSSANAIGTESMLVVSTGIVAAQQVFTVDASGNTMDKGNSQDGSALTNYHGVNMPGSAGTAMAVAGTSNSGDYVAKFYSGAALAAWIKKK
jgi:hypothetical protein